MCSVSLALVMVSLHSSTKTAICYSLHTPSVSLGGGLGPVRLLGWGTRQPATQAGLVEVFLTAAIFVVACLAAVDACPLRLGSWFLWPGASSGADVLLSPLI